MRHIIKKTLAILFVGVQISYIYSQNNDVEWIIKSNDTLLVLPVYKIADSNIAYAFEHSIKQAEKLNLLDKYSDYYFSIDFFYTNFVKKDTLGLSVKLEYCKEGSFYLGKYFGYSCYGVLFFENYMFVMRYPYLFNQLKITQFFKKTNDYYILVDDQHIPKPCIDKGHYVVLFKYLHIDNEFIYHEKRIDTTRYYVD